MTLGESIDFDDKYTNAKISGLDRTTKMFDTAFGIQ